jgi:hypothetical protein
MRVTAYFDEPDIGNLANGQPVTITWEAKPGVTWHGHISQAPTTVISYLTRFVGECFITVDDAGGDLKPNANVNVTVTTAQHSHVLSVPREALRGPTAFAALRLSHRREQAGPHAHRVRGPRHRESSIEVEITSAVSPKAMSSLSTQPPTATSPTVLEITPVQ